MRKKDPLLIVSSLKSNRHYPQSQPSRKIIEPQTTQHHKQQKKFMIRSINNQIKHRTISQQQRQQTTQFDRMNGILKRKNPPLPLQRSFDNNVDLIIGTLLGKQFKQFRSTSRDKTNIRRFTYHIRKQQIGSDFIKKSLLEPCQITSATINQRKRTTFYSRINPKQFLNNKITNFSFRNRYKNISKILPEKLQPWTSQVFEIDQQNF